MFDNFEDFEAGVPEKDALPEEEVEALLRTIDITKEVLSSPRRAKPELLHYAMEGWENLQGYLRDDRHAADLVGEVIELLDTVLRRRQITFEEAQHGKRMIRDVARFYGISTGRGTLA